MMDKSIMKAIMVKKVIGFTPELELLKASLSHVGKVQIPKLVKPSNGGVPFWRKYWCSPQDVQKVREENQKALQEIKDPNAKKQVEDDYNDDSKWQDVDTNDAEQVKAKQEYEQYQKDKKTLTLDAQGKKERIAELQQRLKDNEDAINNATSEGYKKGLERTNEKIKKELDSLTTNSNPNTNSNPSGNTNNTDANYTAKLDFLDKRFPDTLLHSEAKINRFVDSVKNDFMQGKLSKQQADELIDKATSRIYNEANLDKNSDGLTFQNLLIASRVLIDKGQDRKEYIEKALFLAKNKYKGNLKNAVAELDKSCPGATDVADTVLVDSPSDALDALHKDIQAAKKGFTQKEKAILNTRLDYLRALDKNLDTSKVQDALDNSPTKTPLPLSLEQMQEKSNFKLTDFSNALNMKYDNSQFVDNAPDKLVEHAQKYFNGDLNQALDDLSNTDYNWEQLADTWKEYKQNNTNTQKGYSDKEIEQMMNDPNYDLTQEDALHLWENENFRKKSMLPFVSDSISAALTENASDLLTSENVKQAIKNCANSKSFNTLVDYLKQDNIDNPNRLRDPNYFKNKITELMFEKRDTPAGQAFRDCFSSLEYLSSKAFKENPRNNKPEDGQQKPQFSGKGGSGSSGGKGPILGALSALFDFIFKLFTGGRTPGSSNNAPTPLKKAM